MRSRRATTASWLPWRGLVSGPPGVQRCPEKPVPLAGAQWCPWHARRKLYQKVGTFVGSVPAPLFATIALHGLEDVVKKAGGPDKQRENGRRIRHTTFCVRYADDFVVFNNTWEGLQRCKAALQAWRKDRGLALQDTKTRDAHTLEAKEECHGNGGFDFLHWTLRPCPVGKSKSKP